MDKRLKTELGRRLAKKLSEHDFDLSLWETPEAPQDRSLYRSCLVTGCDGLAENMGLRGMCPECEDYKNTVGEGIYQPLNREAVDHFLKQKNWNRQSAFDPTIWGEPQDVSPQQHEIVERSVCPECGSGIHYDKYGHWVCTNHECNWEGRIQGTPTVLDEGKTPDPPHETPALDALIDILGGPEPREGAFDPTLWGEEEPEKDYDQVQIISCPECGQTDPSRVNAPSLFDPDRITCLDCKKVFGPDVDGSWHGNDISNDLKWHTQHMMMMNDHSRFKRRSAEFDPTLWGRSPEKPDYNQQKIRQCRTKGCEELIPPVYDVGSLKYQTMSNHLCDDCFAYFYSKSDEPNSKADVDNWVGLDYTKDRIRSVSKTAAEFNYQAWEEDDPDDPYSQELGYSDLNEDQNFLAPGTGSPDCPLCGSPDALYRPHQPGAFEEWICGHCRKYLVNDDMGAGLSSFTPDKAYIESMVRLMGLTEQEYRDGFLTPMTAGDSIWEEKDLRLPKGTFRKSAGEFDPKAWGKDKGFPPKGQQSIHNIGKVCPECLGDWWYDEDYNGSNVECRDCGWKGLEEDLVAGWRRQDTTIPLDGSLLARPKEVESKVAADFDPSLWGYVPPRSKGQQSMLRTCGIGGCNNTIMPDSRMCQECATYFSTGQKLRFTREDVDRYFGIKTAEFDPSIWMDELEPRPEGQGKIPMGAKDTHCAIRGCPNRNENVWTFVCSECQVFIDATGYWPDTKREVDAWLATQTKTSLWRSANNQNGYRYIADSIGAEYDPEFSWWWKQQAKTASANTYYHVAPRDQIRNILVEGLAGHEPDTESPWLHNNRGNYLFNDWDEGGVGSYAEMMEERSGKPYEIVQVELTPEQVQRLQRDPEDHELWQDLGDDDFYGGRRLDFDEWAEAEARSRWMLQERILPSQISLPESVSLSNQNVYQTVPTEYETDPNWQYVHQGKTAGKTRTQLLNEAQAHEGQYGPDTSEIVKQLADGWTVRRPKTLADIEREGTLMGNCVADGDYNREVSLPRYTEDGVSQSSSLDWGNPEHWNIPSDNYYHSLRDPDNLPHATWTNESNIEGRHGSHPKEEHWSRLREFMPQLPEWEPMTRCWQCGEVRPDEEIVVGEDGSKNCQGCVDYNGGQGRTAAFDLSIWMDRAQVPEDQITWVTGEDDPRAGYLLCPECGGVGHIELFHRGDDEAMSRCGDCGHEWPESSDTFIETRTSAFDKSLWGEEKDKQADQIEWDTCCTDGCDEFATEDHTVCQNCIDYWGNVGRWPSDRQEVEDWYGYRPMSDKTGHTIPRTAATYYHTSPMENRQSIEQHGLDYQKANIEEPQVEQGNYVFDSIEGAERYRSIAQHHFGQQWDLYEVDVDGLHLIPDPEVDYPDASYSPDPIEAERLKRIGAVDSPRGLRPTVPPAPPHAHTHKGLTNPYESASAYLSAVADLGFVVKSE